MKFIFIVILLLITILQSFYFLNRMHLFTTKYKIFRKLFIKSILLFILSLLVLALFGLPHKSSRFFALYFYPNLLFVLIITIIQIFFIFYFFGDVICWFKIKVNNSQKCFLIRRVLHKIALLFSLFVFFISVYGVIVGKNKLQVKHYKLNLTDFPGSFDDIRIAHVSDLHLGSFMQKKTLEKAIEIINKQKPDLIFFTGDLVNISAEEALPYIPILQKLEAPLGKYAVLGNHDMSDYMKLDIKRDSINVNRSDIINYLVKMGFTVLCDSVVYLTSGDDSLAIYGTLPIGTTPYKAHGNFSKLIEVSQNSKFLILLTHHPDLWDQLLKFNFTTTLIAFSGHTHAAQIGIKTSLFKFSFASFIYKYWYGLYEYGNKYIFVSPGLGFIGIPIRIGFYPEIFIVDIQKN